MEYPEITKPSVDEMAVRPNLDHHYVLGGEGFCCPEGRLPAWRSNLRPGDLSRPGK